MEVFFLITCFGPCKVLFGGKGFICRGIGMCACIPMDVFTGVCVWVHMCVGAHGNV